MTSYSTLIGTTSTATIWEGWNSSTTNHTSDTVWYEWNSPIIACGTITMSDCWIYWCNGTGTVQVGGAGAADFAEQYKNQAELRKQQDAERAAADEKALELLKDLITDDEFAVYQNTGRLLVKGRKHNYLIQRYSGKIVRCEKDKVADLCMHLENYHAYSKHDNVIAMKLYLEGKEEQFNREANLIQRRDPQPVEQEMLKVVNQ